MRIQSPAVVFSRLTAVSRVAGGNVRNYVQRRDWILQGFNISGAANDSFLGRGKDMKWNTSDDTTHQLIDNDKGLTGATLGIFQQLRNFLAGFTGPDALRAEGESADDIATAPSPFTERSTTVNLETLARNISRDLNRQADSFRKSLVNISTHTPEQFSQPVRDFVSSLSVLQIATTNDTADKPARIKHTAGNESTLSAVAVDSLFDATSPWTDDFFRASNTLDKQLANRRA